MNFKNSDDDELLCRKMAARYLGGSKPFNPRTLAVWDCTKRYDLQPVRIGRSVRYRKSVLRKIKEEGLKAE